ncbi:helix-turn-helix domain-containing protein [Fodinibacter luteus]|uniref:Helix-turn-helix domain-containing protein n=1 Tax=Fodinibacter luteus TaxID=552064 RepID=A0ABP8KSA8_9MICO
MTAVADHGTAALLASPVRRRLLDVLANEALRGAEPAGLSAAELALSVGLHVTTVRFHLDQLVAAGLVEAAFQRLGGAGRPRKVYTVAPGSLADVDAAGELDSLRLLSGLLADALSPGGTGRTPTPVEVGRRWARQHVPGDADEAPADTPGRWLSKVGRMIDVLQQWGYTPELTTTDGGRTANVRLAHCPFLDLARSNTAVVCGIHRGLIAGSLEQFGETDAEVGLEPFVDPTTCVAHVTTRTPFRSTTTPKEPA